jgi:hypothetical protein
MPAPRDSIDLSDRQASFISLLCAVAQANGSVLTVEDVSSLTSLDATADAFEVAFSANRSLSGSYTLSSGLVVQRNGEARGEEIAALAAETRVRKVRSLANVLYAKEFARYLQTGDIRLVSVSGSTSYLSARKDDDIDFFCITASDTAWLFLSRALLMARVTSLRSRRAPELCFSCVMDEHFARSSFLHPKDALFARDALTAYVVSGSDYYHRLLARSAWMSESFPSLYSRVTAGAVASEWRDSSPSFPRLVINLFLYAVVGRYISWKSRLLNLKFSRWNKQSRVFKVRMGSDHLMYESARYDGLRRMYSDVVSMEGAGGPP